MASFSSKLYPPFNVTVTQEEFNSFHNIDRQLFTCLVVGLERDTTKSTHVMAFMLWVENKIKNRNIVRDLLKWPDVMLNKLADEIEIVLDCIESSTFPYGSSNQKAVPLIQTMMHNTFTLHYFHNNRIEIINGITKFLNEVCLRAFTDIVKQVQYQKAVKEQNLYLANVYGGIPLDPSVHMQPQVVYYAPGITLVPQQVLVPQWNEGNSNQDNTYDVLGQCNLNNQDSHAYGVSTQVNANEDLSRIFANLDLDSGFIDPDVGSVAVGVSDDQKKVAMDDRTIFITFSKGHRISEFEVREFFARFSFLILFGAKIS